MADENDETDFDDADPSGEPSGTGADPAEPADPSPVAGSDLDELFRQSPAPTGSDAADPSEPADEPDQPTVVDVPVEAGPATTGARLEDLFASGRDDETLAGDPSDGVTDANGELPAGRRLGRRQGAKADAARAAKAERITGRERSGYRVRRVRRLLRHIEPWSVLKIGLVFYLCVWGMAVIATSMVWGAASDAGTVDKVERFIEQLFALETFEFDTEQIFRAFVLGGLVMVVGGTAVTVVLVVVFNLISDLMGGIRFTMIEEETAVRRRKVRSGERVLPTARSGERGPPDG